VRLFVALELPLAVRDELVAWRRPVVERHPGLRAVAPESLHVTLCFLGSVDADGVDSIAAAVSAAGTTGPVRLTVGEGIWLPRRRPRVLAVTLADAGGALGRLQAALSRELDEGGWYEPEARPFLPHVTVARVRARERIRPDELPETPGLPFDGSRVTLFRSRPGRGGAQYEPLATVAI
jgi:2'-5' RNA ligase